MPFSRRRKLPKTRPSRNREVAPPCPINGRIPLESIFDDANHNGTGLKGPSVLYHYTSWEAAEAIIASQRFRASAHDCTNDCNELATADATIMEVVQEALSSRPSMVSRRVLRLFFDTYHISQIGASRRAYLVCFSDRRDDPEQWIRYGREGRGVCLGIRLLGSEQPRINGVATTVMPVTYGVDEVRERSAAFMRNVVEVCRSAQDIEHNWRLTLDTLNVVAASWSLATKAEHWKPEREVRMIFYAREGCAIAPAQQVDIDGLIKRYFTVPITARTRMPVHELIIGPNQDFEVARARAEAMFRAARYRNPERKAIRSAAVLGSA